VEEQVAARSHTMSRLTIIGRSAVENSDGTRDPMRSDADTESGSGQPRTAKGGLPDRSPVIQSLRERQ
jgi:hypothetical protein